VLGRVFRHLPVPDTSTHTNYLTHFIKEPPNPLRPEDAKALAPAECVLYAPIGERQQPVTDGMQTLLYARTGY